MQLATPQEIAGQQQRQAIARSQFANQPSAAAPAALRRSAADVPSAAEQWRATVSADVAVARRQRHRRRRRSSSRAARRSAPTVAGIRSLRIELPQTGQPFLFTKVLNIRDEPLSIRARIMPLHTFQTIQMTWQTAAFLFGLVVWWWQWRRGRIATAFILTVALALILGSVCSLLVQWRALHDALIVGFPVVTLAVIAWLVWKYWPRGQQAGTPEPPPEPPAPDCGLPPVMAAIAFAVRSVRIP